MRHFLIPSFFILFLFNHISFSQTVSAPYEVGMWQGFRSAAISYTFDDNCTNQLAVVVPMFNEYDFTLTLFTVINWGPNWAGLQAAATKGHEIASHTMSHPSLTPLSDSLQTVELKNSKSNIEAHITGQKCVTIAYPNCNVGNTSIINQYYFAARICSGVIERSTPPDFMRISSIVCGSQGSVKTGENFKSNADAAASTKGWCVYLLHGINSDGGYSPLSSDTLRVSLEYLKANPSKFWVTSFGTAAKYIRERNAASVSEISATTDSITIAVTDTMDNSYYNCPITVRRPLPEGWSSCDFRQNGIMLASQIVEIASIKYVLFDVVPDQGNIIMKKNTAVGVNLLAPSSSLHSFELFQNYPNPFNPTTTISYYVPVGQNIELKVFDILGNEVTTLVKGFKNTGLHTIDFSKNGLSSGIYFYQLKTEQYKQVKKLMLLR
jgi:peptidoglycan-N-acetylglucosamine deacetylase